VFEIYVKNRWYEQEADNEVSFDQNKGKDSETVQVVEQCSGHSSLHGQIFSKKWEDRINLDFYRPKNPFYPVPLRSPFFPTPRGKSASIDVVSNNARWFLCE